MIGSSFLGYVDASSETRGNEDSSAQCAAPFVRKVIKLQPELLLVLG